MSKQELKSVVIPLVTLDFYKHLANLFRPLPIKADTDMDSIKFSAGQQSVLDYIGRVAKGETQISADESLLKSDLQPSRLAQILGVFK